MNKKKMNLPVSGKFPDQDRWLTMDEYIKFVNFCAINFPRKKMSKNEWFAMHRGIPFSIK